ncbi:hypothetical protein ABPG77_009102 [Micractinium sp. CCAP 211/92]
MTNGEPADLMSIGAHCAHPGCHQLDFLPFKCGSCGKTYCLEHRVCGCTAASNQVVVCPLCARAVIISPGEDVELVFDRHTRTDCDPANYDRVHRKARCPAGSCREKLTSTNSYTCRDCGVTVCLKHRLPSDHQCAGRAASTAAAATGRLSLSQSLRRMLSSGGGGTAAARAAAARPAAAAAAARQQQQKPAAANGSAGGRLRAVTQSVTAAATRTTDSLQSQLQHYRQRQREGGAPTGTPPASGAGSSDVVDLTSSPATAGGGAEACPQCGARFATVQQLIAHAETAHASGWSSGAISMQQPAAGRSGAGGGLERCPHCGRQFADPVELVAHVERQHAAADSNSNCVLC